MRATGVFYVTIVLLVDFASTTLQTAADAEAKVQQPSKPPRRR